MRPARQACEPDHDRRHLIRSLRGTHLCEGKRPDLQTVLDSVSTGAAGSKQLDTFGPKILAGDYAPGFFLKHFVKDMKIALTEANMSNLNLDVLSQVLANYELLQAEGCGDLGTQALIKYYEEEMDV